MKVKFVDILLQFCGDKFDSRETNNYTSRITESINLSTQPQLKILDFRARDGKIFEEFIKKFFVQVEWHLWEPNREFQQALEEIVSRYEDVDVRIIHSEDEIEVGFYDYVILSNCLHSFVPLDFASTLATIQKSLKVGSGKLIVSELYPLVNVKEKYAVSYEESTLIKLLTNLGWKCESGQVQIPAEYVSAYWISAYDPEIKIVSDIEKNANKIRSIWQNEIMPRACARYDGMSKISSVNSFFKYIDEFTSIMSIVNEQRGFWQPATKNSSFLESVEPKQSEYVFKDEDIRIRILSEIESVGIDENLFLNFTNLIVLICQLKNEQKEISTSLILKADDSMNSYYEEHKSSLQELEKNFFEKDTKSLIEDVEQVDGRNRAYLILKKDKNYKIFVQNLRRFNQSLLSQEANKFLDPQWNHIKSLVHDKGCALIATGKSRVKIIAKGKLLAEYRNGEWKLRDFEAYRMQVKALAKSLSLKEDILENVFDKCIFASEKGRGLVFAIQIEHEEVLKRCDEHYRISAELKEKKVVDFSNEEYLSCVAGDGAVVLDANGYTLAINAVFQPQASTNVKPVSKGTRHLNAQKITKETKAIAFVVSVDGPITVFYQGEVVFRVL